MRKRFAPLLILCISALFGNESEPEFASPALANLEGDPSNIVNQCVNVVTGDFIESDVDLVIPGPEPLTIERTFVSTDFSNLINCWNWNHQGHLELHGERAFITDQFGSRTKMQNEGREDKERKYSVHKDSWMSWVTNNSSGEMSGRTNPVNRELCHKERSTYLLKGNGDQYHYFNRKDSDYYLYLMKRANNNQIRYTYDTKKRRNITKITASNKYREEFSSAKLLLLTEGEYKEDPVYEIHSSDGRKVIYHLMEYSKGNFAIYQIERPNAPQVSYSYLTNSLKDPNENRIFRKRLPENRSLEIEYNEGDTRFVDGIKIKKIEPNDPRKKRVNVLKAPVGVDSTPITTHRFIYDIKTKSKAGEGIYKALQGTTTVYDAHMNKTLYHHSKRHRLTKIEKFDGEELYSSENIEWGDQNTPEAINLISRTFEDAAGNIQFARNYTYDDRGNVIEDRLSGNITGTTSDTECCVKTFVYADNEANWLLEENDGRKSIRYDYDPHNNQPIKKLVISEGKTLLRTFYEYDKNATIVSEVTDDGYGDQVEDLSGVTERHIKRIQPAPNGLPEVIEEKYLDLVTGEEVLLGRVVNSYSIEGWLTKQERYDANGELAYTLIKNYNNLGKVIYETDPLGQETERRYDANGNCVYEQGPRKDVHKEMAYDFSNRCIREELICSDGLRLSTHHKYDYCNNRVATVDSNGHETKYEYDPFGRCVKIIQPLVPNEENLLVRPVQTAEFNVMSQPVRVVDARGGETRCRFNLRGQPLEKIYPDGSCERFEYTLDGLVAKSFAKNGMITIFAYDPFGREIEKEEFSPEGEMLGHYQTLYNTFHKIAEIDCTGKTTHYEYDNAGRLTRIFKESKETEYRYDPLGRVSHTIEWTSETDALVKIQEYDLLDRVIEERTEDLQGNVYRQTRAAYDEAGNKTHIWDDTRLILTEYSPFGEAILVTDGQGNKTNTHIQYDYLNEEGLRVKRVATTDPKGNVSISQFDALGREIKTLRLNPLGKKTQEREFRYDLSGNRVQSIDHVMTKNQSDRQVINAWEYDLCQREVKRIEAAGTLDQKVISTFYNTFGQKEKTIKPDGVELIHTYDAKGRLETLRSSDDTVHYRYVYDTTDNPIEVHDEVHHTLTSKTYSGEKLTREVLGNGLEVKYTYDRLERPVKILYPDGSGALYQYRGPDIAKITRIINDRECYLHTYDDYDLSGNLLKSTMIQHAGTLTYQYDSLGRLTSMTHPLWSEEDISYDQAGNLISSKTNGTVSQFDYDDLYHLLKECGLVDNSYEYDSLHNRTAKNGHEHKINGLNQLIEDSLTSYRYDSNGNLLNFGDSKLSYDALDRLTKVITPEGEHRYHYDESHRRITKTGPNETQHFIYLGKNEIGSTDASGKTQELRILGHGLGAEIGASIAIEKNGKCYAPIHDHIGNLVCLVNPHKTEIVSQYKYSVYGEEQTEGDLISWRFSSKRVDPETSLVYFGRRYYAPSQGRWITQDPAGFSAGINLYAFVNNNPLTHLDLYGLTSRFWKDALKGALIVAGTYLSGYPIQILGDQMIPIPGVQDLFSYSGRILSCQSLEEYTPTWKRIPAKNFTVGKGELSDKIRFTACNGIGTDEASAYEFAEHVSKTHGNAIIHFSHMETYGLSNDLYCHYARQKGRNFEPVAKLLESFRTLIQEMGGVNGGGRIFHKAHSEGGFITYIALKHMTPEERKMIYVETYGSAKLIDLEGLGGCINYINEHDYVPLLSDRDNYLKACRGEMDNVRFLPSNNLNPLTDHRIMKGNYKNMITAQGFEIQKQYGSL